MDFLSEAINYLSEGKTIDTLVKLCSQHMNNPLLLIDTTANVIASYGGPHIVDNQFPEALKDIMAQIKTLDDKWIISIMQKVVQFEDPVLTTHPLSKLRGIVSKVSVGSHIMGYYLCIETDNDFSEDIIEKARQVCKVLSICFLQIHSYDLKDNDNNSIEVIIKKILLGEVLSTEEELMRAFYKYPEDSYHVLVAGIPNDNLSFTKQYSLNIHFKNYIEVIHPRIKVVHYDSFVVIILPINRKTTLNFHLKRLTHFLQAYNMTAGISDPFADILQLRKYYFQALRTYEIGKKLSRGIFSLYSDIMPYDLLLHVAGETRLDEYLHPAFICLEKYDKEFNTVYMDTLYEYLLMNGNITDTANTLSTHRNTIVYRIEKIQELTACNLEDGRERMKLLLSYYIRELYFYPKKD